MKNFPFSVTGECNSSGSNILLINCSASLFVVTWITGLSHPLINNESLFMFHVVPRTFMLLPSIRKLSRRLSRNYLDLDTHSRRFIADVRNRFFASLYNWSASFCVRTPVITMSTYMLLAMVLATGVPAEFK